MTATEKRNDSALDATAAPAAPRPRFDLEAVRADFPILRQEVRGKSLVYLDNAASAQRPRAVVEAVEDCYYRYYSNVHRGVHTLSQRSTEAYEAARDRVVSFLNASSRREVVFVRGTTEAINLVAQSWGRRNLGEGDEVLLTVMEHHSNIVPWQLLCDEVGAHIRVLDVDDRGELRLDQLDDLLGERTRLLALTHVSNALGTINPIREIVERAHAHGVPVLVDGAQGAPHLPVDVQGLGCDFYAFSGHKVFGPTGIGVLWTRESMLEEMPPWQGGGEMISRVSFERTEFAELPDRFEAGTPNIAGAIGLAAALDYVGDLGLEAIGAWEDTLVAHATSVLESIPGLRLVGKARERAGVVSFLLEGVHAHDVGTILDDGGIAVRAGHHCAQPLMERFGVPSTVRASFAFYNTLDEVERLAEAVERARAFFEGD